MLPDVRCFLAVAKHMHFSKAATELRQSKAAVSTAIKRLETLLGTRLLQRSTRTVLLTADGKMFRDKAQLAVDGFTELEQMFRTGSGQLTGRIRIDLPAGFARNVVIPVLPEFLVKYPQLSLELSSSDRIVDVLGEGFDCVLRVGTLRESSLVAKKLGDLPVINCASPAYLRKRKLTRLSDLKNHLLIHYSPGFAGADSFEIFDGATTRNLEMTASIAVNHTDSYEAAALAGFGIIQVPLIAVAAHLQSGRLVEVLRGHRAKAMPVNLLFPSRHMPERVRIFANWLTVILQHALTQKPQ